MSARSTPNTPELPPITVDKDAAYAMLQESGHADHVFEISSIDDDYRRNTTDAVAAQLRDAGFNVERVVIPGSTFWNDWTTYPFSSTNWNHRELGVQILNLAYRSGVAWNESGFANPEFDALLDQANGIQDADARREVMAELRRSCRKTRDAAALLAVALPALQAGVINADMHPKFEINIHYLGVSA
jgi:peptide/nickel transport system substrate-binding protein